MEEYTAVCVCGRRVVLKLGPQAQTKQCPNCGALVRIPAASVEDGDPLSGFKPTNREIESQSDVPDEVSLFFDQDEGVAPESLSEPEGSTPEPPLAAPPKKEPSCARCGRAFRGDWDQIETENGLFCHLCSNLAFEQTTRKETAPLVTETEVSKAMKPSGWNIFDQKQVHVEREARKDGHRQWEMIALAVVATITLLAIYFWPQSADTEPDPTVKTHLSGITLILVYSLMAVLSFAATATTIYLTLQQTNRLDLGGFKANLPSVLWGAFLLSIIWGFVSIIPIPLLPVIIAIGLSVVILDNLYGFWGMDFVYFLVINSVVNLLFWGIKALIFGTIGITLS